MSCRPHVMKWFAKAPWFGISSSILYTVYCVLKTNWQTNLTETTLCETWLGVNNVSYLTYSQTHHLFKCWNMNISLRTIDFHVNKVDWITYLTLTSVKLQKKRAQQHTETHLQLTHIHIFTSRSCIHSTTVLQCCHSADVGG